MHMQALAPSLFVFSVVSSRHAVKQNHHGSLQPGDNIDVFLLPNRPMTFHNVIVVSYQATECGMRREAGHARVSLLRLGFRWEHLR